MACSKPENIWEYIDDLLHCPLCFKKSKDPRALPCQHWFCSPCIKQLVKKSVTNGKLACPTCRKLVKVQKILDGTAEFPVAYIINSLDEYMSKQGPVMDTWCAKHREKIRWQCKRCIQPLCTSCVQLDHEDHPKVPSYGDNVACKFVNSFLHL